MSRRQIEDDGIGAVSRRHFVRTSALLGGGLIATSGIARAASAGAPSRGPYFDVRDFGAIGDGKTDDTRALQRTLDSAHQVGGGIVQVPAGTWLSGGLQLHSRLTVDLAPGATLLASPEGDDFPPYERGRGDSDVETTDFAHALLAGRDLDHVTIQGAGVIDMNRDSRFGPKPIALRRCRFVTIRDVTILRSPNYCVSLGGCDDVLVDGVTIRDAYADGIDPDCCRRVRISNCDVEADDDALCLKTSFHLGARHATEEVTITNCRLRSPSNCFKLGTESSGDFRQIVLSNCVLNGLPAEHHDDDAAEGGGIALLTVDGGTIDGVVVANVVMHDVAAPLFLRLGNRGRDQARRAPGKLRNVTISGIVALGASDTSSISGLPDHPIERVVVENVRIATTGGSDEKHGLDVPERAAEYPEVSMYGDLPAFGLYVRHGRDVVVRNVELNVERADVRPALVADDVAQLRLTGVGGGSVWLNDIQGGLVQGNLVPEGVYLRVTGENTKSVALTGWTPGAVEVAPEITPTGVMPVADTALRRPS
jgi:polygalacturonase